MIVLTVNTGSTSVKLAVFRVQADPDAGEAPVRLSARHLAGTSLDPRATLEGFLEQLEERPTIIAHRIVHGGTRFTGPTLLDEGAREALAALSELAPLHNPVALRWIDAA